MVVMFVDCCVCVLEYFPYYSYCKILRGGSFLFLPESIAVKAVISLSVEVKNVYVGTLLAFLFVDFSDGVLCFRCIFCVVFLSFVHLQVRVCAYGRIDRAISGT